MTVSVTEIGIESATALRPASAAVGMVGSRAAARLHEKRPVRRITVANLMTQQILKLAEFVPGVLSDRDL
jgi:hypothetical protein